MNSADLFHLNQCDSSGDVVTANTQNKMEGKWVAIILKDSQGCEQQIYNSFPYGLIPIVSPHLNNTLGRHPEIIYFNSRLSQA